MLSRVADSLYWMSRYLERAEHTARLLDVHLNLTLEQDPDTSGRRWSRVLASLGHNGPLEGDPFSVAQAYAINQLIDCIMSARENARQVREQVSSEMWEQLNRLFHEVKRIGVTDIWDSQPLEFLGAVKESSHLFQGITDSTMNHGEGWHFIQVGRFMERATATTTLLDFHFRALARLPDQLTDSDEHMEWIGLLKSCTAFEAYCKVYTADLKPDRIAEFLVLNSEFPHSIRFAAGRIAECLEFIHNSTSTRKAAGVAKLAGRLGAALSFTPLDEIMGGLRGFFADVHRQCRQIHSAIYQVYISYPIEAALDI